MSAKLTTHPPNETLRALNLGKLDDATAQGVLQHLEACPECCQKAASLPGDSFLNRLRDVHAHKDTPAVGWSLPCDTEVHQPPGPSSDATSGAARVPTAPPSRVSRFPTVLPASFGRYRLLKLLGKGGMGAVYLAQDTQLDRQVALKVPHFDDVDGPQVLERFFREARSAATIQHANICPLHDVGEIDGTPYLTMAYLEGKPLREFAAGRPLSSRQAGLLVRKLALALQEAHKRGVIHRDLKPENIMIDKRGEPIIMDFGLARRTRGQDPRLTQRGSVLGTPAYMPPEQVSGNVDATGPASDIYSLGVLFYELLTGRLPFQGDAMSMLSQVLMDEPPRPTTLRPELEPELEAICLKAMAKKIEDRYASMAEFAAALTDTLRARPPAPESGAAPIPKPIAPPKAKKEGQSIHVSQMGGMRSVAMLFNQPPAPKVDTDKPRRLKRPKRRRIPAWTWLAGAGVGVMLLLLAGLWAAGVFRVKTQDGVYEVHVNEPGAQVYVDNEKTTVTWDNGGKTAEIRVPPGTHKVEVKKDGFTAQGEEVTVGEGDRKSITARLIPLAADKDSPAQQLVHLAPSAADKGEELHQIHWPRPSSIYTASFSPDDGRCIIAGDRDELVLYDVQSGQSVGRRMKGYVAAYLPNGKEILTGEKTGSVFHIYDLNGAPLREFHGKDDLWNFTASPRGDRLLTMSPGSQRLWDLKNGKELKNWLGNPDIFTFFSPDGQVLFRQVDGKVPWRVYRADNGEEVNPLEYKNLINIDGLRGFFPDGKRIYGRSNNGVSVYDVSSGRVVEELDMGISPANIVTMSADGKRFLTYDHHQVYLWDLASHQKLCSFSASNIAKLHYLPFNLSNDGRFACAGGDPGIIYLWRLPPP